MPRAAQRTVILSGLHSGTNPSPGLGIARSLRAAHFELRIIGLDYSPNSSGLHSALLDERIVLPSWDEVDVRTWAQQLEELLLPDAVFVSSLDLEVRLIAQELHRPEKFLSPGENAIQWVRKPPVAPAERLGMRLAPSLTYVWDNREAEQFIRSCPNGAWVKGQHYEAFRVFTLTEALAAGKHIESLWGGPWHFERHVSGQEGGIAFVAVSGELIDAVQMRKTVLTATSKTWAGELAEVAPGLKERLRAWVRETGWHGGGEVEVIEGWDGGMTLMEVNPRFPAWIHGATVSLRNLPLALLTGELQPQTSSFTGFTRVIEEIPSHPTLGTPSFPWSPDEQISAAQKHPSGMPSVARRGLVRFPVNESNAPDDDSSVTGRQSPAPPFSTPHLEIRPDLLSAQLEAVRIRFRHEPLTFAYSVKTNPDPRLIAEALKIGMSVEAITQDELQLAARVGASASQLILNGPAKWWPKPVEVACEAIFIDSVPELTVLADLMDGGLRVSTKYLGLRLSRSSMQSRFGVKVDHPQDLLTAASGLEVLTRRLNCDWGVHFHTAESVIGVEQWIADCRSSFEGVEVLTAVLGRPPGIVDFGGGWHTNDVVLLPGAVDEVVRSVPSQLDATHWIFELGKSLVEPTGRLFTTVIVPPNSDGDVVVDAGISDLPEGPSWPHPVHMRRDGHVTPLHPGEGRILGRTCMERDVLARNLSLEIVRPGDVLVFDFAGGYDTAMAYDFGRGIHRGSMRPE